MVEQIIFYLRKEDGGWKKEVLISLLNQKSLILSKIPYRFLLSYYFSSFLISSINISRSGWYFPLSFGVFPSGSS